MGPLTQDIKGIFNLPPHKFITNDELAFVFGRRLKEIRERRGLSRWKLAKLTGFAEESIRNYERGRRMPCYRFLLALVTEVGVSLSEIFGLSKGDWENREEYHTIYGIPNPAYKHPKRQRPKPYPY